MVHTPPFEPDPDLFPFRSRWFDSSAGRVHYVDEGEGVPILFLHGNPTWSFLYRGIIVRLRKQFRCVALDYPGFGLSEHPEGYGYLPDDHAGVVRELVEHLDLTDLTIMGHDWGGPIGLNVALDEIERMHALVLGNTWYWPIEDVRMRMAARILDSRLLRWLVVERNFLVERVMPFGVNEKMPPGVRRHYRRPFPTAESRTGMAELPRQLLGSAFWLGQLAHAVPRMLGRLPVLLTWGEDDPLFRPAFIDRFKEDFERVEVRRLEAKHLIQEDRAPEISESIREFLAEA